MNDAGGGSVRLFPRMLSVREMTALAGREVVEAATADESRAIAEEFDLLTLTGLKVSARALREGKDGWRIDGRVDAKISQPCVITLDPVTQTISETFTRRFVPGEEASAGAELTIDPEEDDPPEPLGNGVHLGDVALEVLALAIDPYPRAPGAVFSGAAAGEDDAEDEPVKPFAALAALKKSSQDRE